jgi:hypothetical protein
LKDLPVETSTDRTWGRCCIDPLRSPDLSTVTPERYTRTRPKAHVRGGELNNEKIKGGERQLRSA